MSEPVRSSRVVSDAAGGVDEWFDDADAARAAIANRLGIDTAAAEALKRRVSTDPIVVRRDDGRWRSAGVWIYRSGAASVRLLEMIRVDEAAYDH
jgi:hypothetical protein